LGERRVQVQARGVGGEQDLVGLGLSAARSVNVDVVDDELVEVFPRR
jgi:hypothetical protein